MYSWINSRSLSSDSVIRPTSVYMIWEEQNAKSLIFLHGANVNESQAEAWGDILFKRMWVSGIRADFYNVDWRSNIGGPANYHENASNAFVVASQLASILRCTRQATVSIQARWMTLRARMPSSILSSRRSDRRRTICIRQTFS